MLLTSAGFENKRIGEKFVKLVDKPVQLIKVIFVPTASRTKEELKYVEAAKKELLNFGIKVENITALNLNHNVSYNEVKNFDVIYVCGGNTFWLLHKVRETGFDKVIKQFLNNDKLYVGVSAGSILVGPNIEIAVPFDENDIGLTNFTGLNLVKVVISPHYTVKEKLIIDQYKKQLNCQIIPLTDRQACLVIDNQIELVE